MDRLTPEKRSWNMSRIRSKDTKPEITVRKWLYNNGYRYRIHYEKIPGKPDIVFPGKKTVIFIHGCFWHRHPGCKYAYTPKSNINRWQKKFDDNVKRDRTVRKQLENLGWKIIVIWECQVKDESYKEILSNHGFNQKIIR